VHRHLLAVLAAVHVGANKQMTVHDDPNISAVRLKRFEAIQADDGQQRG
jgi:hypothetical protein